MTNGTSRFLVPRDTAGLVIQAVPTKRWGPLHEPGEIVFEDMARPKIIFSAARLTKAACISDRQDHSASKNSVRMAASRDVGIRAKLSPGGRIRSDQASQPTREWATNCRGASPCCAKLAEGPRNQPMQKRCETWRSSRVRRSFQGVPACDGTARRHGVMIASDRNCSRFRRVSAHGTARPHFKIQDRKALFPDQPGVYAGQEK